jgi:terminase small subunit-like protein
MAKSAAPRRIGRPSTFTPELATTICIMIEDGKTIDQIQATAGMPAWETIRRWLRTKPTFQALYARAHEASALTLEHEAITVARSAKDSDSAACARVMVDTIKWAAAHRNPKVYGQRLATQMLDKEGNPTDPVPTVAVDLSTMLAGWTPPKK